MNSKAGFGMNVRKPWGSWGGMNSIAGLGRYSKNPCGKGSAPGTYGSTAFSSASASSIIFFSSVNCSSKSLSSSLKNDKNPCGIWGGTNAEMDESGRCSKNPCGFDCVRDSADKNAAGFFPLFSFFLLDSGDITSFFFESGDIPDLFFDSGDFDFVL